LTSLGPAPPASYTQAVAAAAQALDHAPTDGQLDQLARFVDLLQRWNATYNLTAVREPAAIITQHIADSLTVVPLVRRYAPAGRLLDVGSGGGLPGVVIAIMLPEWTVNCVDAVGKKAAFVRQVGGTLGLSNLRSVHSRVEALAPQPPFDLIVSRAFAALPDFVALTQRLLAPDGAWLAMKGKRPNDEIAALPTAIEVFHVEPLAVPGLDAERCAVWMKQRPVR